ncbi:hypothetical protein SB658_27740, partial [Bacillus sp. SIMBA_008]|uniref:hypothetical protein n=1 Tax=Bacillus sp. SIMBA_008 TaxID=3085757 RepID=UPI00397E212B
MPDKAGQYRRIIFIRDIAKSYCVCAVRIGSTAKKRSRIIPQQLNKRLYLCVGNVGNHRNP